MSATTHINRRYVGLAIRECESALELVADMTKAHESDGRMFAENVAPELARLNSAKAHLEKALTELNAL
jgi:hypothetical protein